MPTHDWNPVTTWERVSFVSAPVLQQTYLWGVDLGSSGKAEFGGGLQLQQSGGVGGLISSTHYNSPLSKEHHLPSSDANGNNIAWSGGTGALLRKVDYDVFGNEVLVEDFGVTSKLPEFGFSTKIKDAETGLSYYGHRYYDPKTGRWPSRDPIGEEGGINLYGFVGNDGLNQWGYLGNYIGPGYGTLPIPVSGNDRNRSETIGDASVPSVLSHIAGNILNSAGGFNYNNQAADYFTYIYVLGLSSSAIDGTLDPPAASLFQRYPEIKNRVAKGESVDVDHLVTWFAFPREQTIGHINVKITGNISCQSMTDLNVKWKFKGDLAAEPDRFDFDQKVRTGVTGSFSIGLWIPEVIMGHTTGWFYIKMMDQLKDEEYEGYIRK